MTVLDDFSFKNIRSYLSIYKFELEETKTEPFNFAYLKEVVSSGEFKFWMKRAISLAGLLGSFYSIYKLFKMLDTSNPLKSRQVDAGKSILKKLGIETSTSLNDYELIIASNIVSSEDVSVDWSDIGGLDDVVKEVANNILSPLGAIDENIKSKLYQPPKGILLFGPPGCGKTMLVKAIAKSTNARFINLKISNIMDMYFGESVKYIDAVFSLAKKIEPVIIFIDEIDGLMVSRSKYTTCEASNLVKTTFMGLWDGLLTEDKSRIMIVGATNRPSVIDPAILRRLQVKIEIKLPDHDQRKSIFKVILKNEITDESITETTYNQLSSMTDGLSGSHIKDICTDATIQALHDYTIDYSSSKAGFQLSEDSLLSSTLRYMKRNANLKIYK